MSRKAPRVDHCKHRSDDGCAARGLADQLGLGDRLGGDGTDGACRNRHLVSEDDCVCVSIWELDLEQPDRVARTHVHARPKRLGHLCSSWFIREHEHPRLRVGSA